MTLDLTPKGLPYGDNKRAAANQRAAGLPQSTEARPSSTARDVAQQQQARPPARMPGAPPSDDPLMVLNPSAPVAVAPTKEQRLQQIAERSVNPFIRLIAARIANDSQP